jgi:hypothetical protein
VRFGLRYYRRRRPIARRNVAAIEPDRIQTPFDCRVLSVIREDVLVEVSQWPYFSSDCVGIKTTMRLGFAFAHPQSIAKIVAGGS